ncbi:hypothetical protein [Candidatus Symbiobacter mobilis]|uniref:hypothetical protein n=1 Tax=Candidatus Symbiobacter mobilis TaxID=1436290 RepID=UPI0019308D4C|nr:hypothetical protein [Candidatus Symbiobacter mobilis]
MRNAHIPRINKNLSPCKVGILQADRAGFLSHRAQPILQNLYLLPGACLLGKIAKVAGGLHANDVCNGILIFCDCAEYAVKWTRMSRQFFG